MKVKCFVLFSITTLIYWSCTKEAKNDDRISYQFLDKELTFDKKNVDAILFENVLCVNIYADQSSNENISSIISFAIHNPSLGTFNITKSAKHGFDYVILTDFPSLVQFTLADQNGTIKISELDLERKTISFKIQLALSSEDVKNQALEINVDNTPMKVKYKKAAYLKYLSENTGLETYSFAVDTIRVNKEGEFSLFSDVGFLDCYFDKPISLKKYTQIDDVLLFRFGPYATLKTANEYEVILEKADHVGVRGEFQASIYYPNFGETARYKNGYFEMFIEK